MMPMHPPAKDKLNQFRTCPAQGGGTVEPKTQKINCFWLLTRLQVRLMRGSTHPSLGMRCWKCFCIMPFARSIEHFEVLIHSEIMRHIRSLKFNKNVGKLFVSRRRKLFSCPCLPLSWCPRCSTSLSGTQCWPISTNNVEPCENHLGTTKNKLRQFLGWKQTRILEPVFQNGNWKREGVAGLWWGHTCHFDKKSHRNLQRSLGTTITNPYYRPNRTPEQSQRWTFCLFETPQKCIFRRFISQGSRCPSLHPSAYKRVWKQLGPQPKYSPSNQWPCEIPWVIEPLFIRFQDTRAREDARGKGGRGS